MNKLQATLRDLAAGRAKPNVQWLNFETKTPVPTYSKSAIFQATGKQDERLLETQTDESLRNLPQARLRSLLAAQEAIANKPICKRLPDGGAKIQKKIEQIRAALDYVIKVDAMVVALDADMHRLSLSADEMSTEEQKQMCISATSKLERLQKAKQPYSQASRAVHLLPMGPRPGLAPKYLPSPPKFLPFAEAAELSRQARLAAMEQEQSAIEERHHEVVPSKGSAFSTGKWHPPVDFSNEPYRDPQESDEEELEDEVSEQDDVLDDLDNGLEGFGEELPSW